MRSFFFSIIILFLSLTIISCGQTTEESVASVVSSTNDAVNNTTGAIDNTLFGDTEDGSCPSVGTFQKNISARQVKQTNDCGYIVVGHAGTLTKLDKYGETEWENKFTLKLNKHSNLGKSSVLQTSDGGYFFSGPYGIAKLSSAGELEWTNKKNGDFEDAIEHSNGYYYVVSDDLVAHKSLAKVYKFSSNGKKVWIKRFGGGCSWEKLRSILETSDGELIIVGGKVMVIIDLPVHLNFTMMHGL